jgi:thymidylate synthase (FAD)
MKVIDPSFEILRIDDEATIVRLLETAARNCYKSVTSETIEEALDFLDRQIVQSGHHSVLEHINVTVDIICDRGISHEIVRHRIASYSQESTRYCDYSKGKHGNEITVIRPFFWEPEEGDCVAVREQKERCRMSWTNSMYVAEKQYLFLLDSGASAQEARSVLPNSLKTGVVMTANLRSFINFFQQRTAITAHPQMREIARPMLDEFKRRIPLIFDDINY